MATLEEWEAVYKQIKVWPWGHWNWQNAVEAICKVLLFIVEDKISELKDAGKR